ncbi:MAG: NADH-quinone oxidoreductase subunit 5 family protein [Lacipirellulaceae bacterium]
MAESRLIPTLLLAAWLAPLASFVVVALATTLLHRLRGVVSASAARAVGQVCTGTIATSFLLSLAALAFWVRTHGVGGDAGEGDAGHHAGPPPMVGEWFTFLEVGTLRLATGYYIDALTLVMATLVTFVALCVHLYSLGYLDDELSQDCLVTDAEARLAGGAPVVRPARLHRFYQHLALFTFSMLGIVFASSVAMTFVFWELVGATSYLLIGFYYERPAAARAAAKAMLVNRIGDVGMLVAIALLWSAFGTLDYEGLFGAVGPWLTADPMNNTLLTIAGVGLFCGAIGKSAQAPLWSWLPDAMQGPTPVSALVHSATMVAAGVFLTARVFPLLTAEALAVVAAVGAVTLILGAILAVSANDLKRVLAYSTISQLGYMVLGLGVGGWTAATLHLVTHASFKALLFLAAGAAIHGAHVGEFASLGGLRRRMPLTAAATLVGALALVGAGIPILGLGLSGFYSKDLLFEQAIAYARANPGRGWAYWAPTIGAALTAFYIARLWLLTFAGEPRSKGAADAHEASSPMLAPMAALGIAAVGIAWALPGGLSVKGLLESAATVPATSVGVVSLAATVPSESAAHTDEIKRLAALTALGATLVGLSVAGARHRLGKLADPPTAKLARGFDLRWVPGLNRAIADTFRRSGWALARWIDSVVIDRGVGGLTSATVFASGGALARLQTGNVRQYVVLLVLAVAIAGSVALGVAYRWAEGV